MTLRSVVRALTGPALDGDDRRRSILSVALAIAGIVTLIYTAPLWQPHDLPPQAPPFSIWPPRWTDTPLLLGAIAGLLLLFAERTRVGGALIFTVSMLGLLLGDQQRWQPGIQMFLLFALALAAWKPGGARPGAPAILRLYVVSLYAYSGIQKLHAHFTLEVAPWLLDPLLGWARITPASVSDGVWTALGIAMALAEMSVAILLFTPRTRGVGISLTVVLHLFVLLALGPLGHDWNTVVWPWNAFMVVAVPALFWGLPGPLFAPLRSRPLLLAAAAAVAIYPAGYAVGLVDAYPAHNLYTGFPGDTSICVGPDVALPAAWDRYATGTRVLDDEAWRCIDEVRWYLDAVRVPPYIAPRVQAVLALSLCDELGVSEVVMVESERAALLRFGRASLTRTTHEYRGCDAIRARADAGVFGSTTRSGRPGTRP